MVKRDAARRFRGLTDLKPMEVAELPEAALGAWRRVIHSSSFPIAQSGAT